MPRLVFKARFYQPLLCVSTDIEVIDSINHCRDMPPSSQPRGQHLNSPFKGHFVQVLYLSFGGNEQS